MMIVRDVLAELFGMFVGDARLSAAILLVVAVAAGLTSFAHATPLAGGVLLLVGCLVVLIGAVRRAARRKSAEAALKRSGPT